MTYIYSLPEAAPLQQGTLLVKPVLSNLLTSVTTLSSPKHGCVSQVAFMVQAGLEYDQCTPEELNAKVQPSSKPLWELLAQVEESKWNRDFAVDLRTNPATRTFFKVHIELLHTHRRLHMCRPKVICTWPKVTCCCITLLCTSLVFEP